MLRIGALQPFFDGTAGDSGSLCSIGSRIELMAGDKLFAVIPLLNAIEKHLKVGD